MLRVVQDEFQPRAIADASIKELAKEKHTLYIAPQVLYEFWSTVTRPEYANGFGWEAFLAYKRVFEIINTFALLPESPSVFKRWLSLVQKYEVKGKRTHDARLVAVMLENGVDKLLTFNTGDFEAFTEIKVIHPADVVANAT